MLNLHSHSEYSFQDAIAKVQDIAAKEKELGSDCFAITDHGTVASFPKAFAIAKKMDMHFIPGIELYVTPPENFDIKARTSKMTDLNGILRRKTETKESHQDARMQADALMAVPSRRNFHLTLLSKNQEGLNNLFRIYNTGETYYKYRVPFDGIVENKEGIIVLSGCIGGELAFYVRHNMTEEAENFVQKCVAEFGEDYYIEIQYHGIGMFEKEEKEGVISEIETYMEIIRIANKYEAKLVATNDSHYINEEDKKLHNIYKGICYHKTGDQKAGEFGFHGEGYHMVTEEELKSRFLSVGYTNLDEMFSNVDEIKSKIDFNQDILKDNSFRECDKELADLAWAGWKDIRVGTEREQESKERVAYELSVISDKRKSYYFVDVREIVAKAKELKIMTGPGRGSAAGSEIAYLIGITKTDPLKYGLMFERFMNPSRFDMPDIDVDFESKLAEYDDRQGSEVVCEHLKDKFVFQGAIENVVKASRVSLIKKLGSFFDIPFSDCNKFTTTESTKELLNEGENKPDLLAFKYALSSIGLQFSDKWQQLYDNLDLCYKLDGIVFGSSVHASGRIMSRNDVILPINDKGVVNFNGTSLEGYDYTKYDLLSVDALNSIKDILGIDLDWQDVYDPEVFKLMRTGDTDFIFQIAGGIPKQMLREGAGNNIEEISEISAINRPGPLGMGLNEEWIDIKNNRHVFEDKEAEVISGLLKQAFGETHSGLIVYQEDVMKLCVVGADFTLAEADRIRKAMGKKMPEILAQYRDQFIKNWKFEGNSIKIWEDLEDFASYAFNKSHAVSYSIISYFTGILWLYHKEEYLEWMMNYGSKKKVAALEACQKLGISMKFPRFADTKKSDKYRVEGNSVYLPFGYDGKYGTFSEFIFSDKSLTEKLYFVNSGALDYITPDRAGLNNLVSSIPAKSQNIPYFPECQTLSELLEYGKMSELWSYTVKDKYFDISVKKPRSDKRVIIYKNRRSLPDCRLENNMAKDLKFFGFRKPGALSSFPDLTDEINLTRFNNIRGRMVDDRVIVDIPQPELYQIKTKLTKELGDALHSPRTNRFFQELAEAEYVVQFKEVVYFAGRSYASTTLSFDSSDQKFYPRDSSLIERVQKIDKKTICRLNLSFDSYINKNLEAVLMLKIKDIWEQEIPQELEDI